MSNPLLHELAHHQYLPEQLAAQFPDTDEETLLDTLEGITDLNEMIASVVRSRLDDLALHAALRARMSNMQERAGPILIDVIQSFSQRRHSSLSRSSDIA